jgi:hypothetical protein
VGGWYSIGVWLGLGVAFGVLVAGVLAGLRAGLLAAAIGAAAVGFAVGWSVDDWSRGLAAAIGGALGAFGAAQIATGALRRGGTRTGTAILLLVGAVVLAALAFVPVVGYLEPIAIPALALQLRRRTPERYAGLRTLAK